LTIFVIVAAAAGLALVTGITGTNASSDRVGAAQVAQQESARARAMSRDSLTATPSVTSTATRGSKQYTVRRTVSYLGGSGCPTALPTGSATATPRDPGRRGRDRPRQWADGHDGHGAGVLTLRAGVLRRRPSPLPDDAGVTLTELVVTMSLMSIVGALSLSWFLGSSTTTTHTIDALRPRLAPATRSRPGRIAAGGRQPLARRLHRPDHDPDADVHHLPTRIWTTGPSAWRHPALRLRRPPSPLPWRPPRRERPRPPSWCRPLRAWADRRRWSRCRPGWRRAPACSSPTTSPRRAHLHRTHDRPARVDHPHRHCVHRVSADRPGAELRHERGRPRSTA